MAAITFEQKMETKIKKLGIQDKKQIDAIVALLLEHGSVMSTSGYHNGYSNGYDKGYSEAKQIFGSSLDD